MYNQDLYKILDNHIKPNIVNKYNKTKKWEYGYNKEHDIIVISKTGQIGEIYEIENLKIALPLIETSYKRSNKKSEQYWEKLPYPKQLEKIKTVFEWNGYPENFKEQWYDYIDNEFKRRDEGFVFNNNGKATYISGAHYMYLQWTKIDVGAAEFRESNRLFFLFWEACCATVCDW